MSEKYKPINNLWKDSEGYRYFGTLKLSSKIKYNGDDFIPLWEWVEQLQQENKKQQEVIDKAIEFIKSSQCKYDGWEIANQLYENEIKQLLDMLKDKEV